MNTAPSKDDADIFEVSGAMAFFSWLICEHPEAWQAIGRLETSILQDKLDEIRIDKPVYVAGLARAGSTIMLEILNEVPGIVSQRYKDFPPVFTPYAWNALLRHMSSGKAVAAERAHKDGILVTQDSPEAMEEPIWMSFFPHAHDPAQSNVLGSDDASREFREFYVAHIKKLLAVRGGDRYLAKANYQVTRLELLLELFPDARFVIPVREPAAHIASLAKQHDLFSRGQRANERARQHLRRVGHYEFGLDRVPINTGDQQRTAEILRLWHAGDEITGWARYWAMIYGYLAERLEHNPALRDAAHIVIFEDLCAEPERRLNAVFDHCSLNVDEEFRRRAAARIQPPGYYKSKFSDDQLFVIGREAGDTMQRIRDLAATQG